MCHTQLSLRAAMRSQLDSEATTDRVGLSMGLPLS